MYSLYYNKEARILKVGKEIKKDWIMVTPGVDGVIRYNGCYYVCNNKKLLRQKALELKEEWIKEAEEELSLYKNIEIKVK